MREVLRRIGPILRAHGFRGSAQSFRKTDGDWRCVVNFQGSRWGDEFYVNLGAHPMFIPAEGNADIGRLKEYECMLRTRVGGVWTWEMSDEAFVSFKGSVLAAQVTFFGQASRWNEALAAGSVNELMDKFRPHCVSPARLALHLARAAAIVGRPHTARDLVERGLALSTDRADILRAELNAVLESLGPATA